LSGKIIKDTEKNLAERSSPSAYFLFDAEMKIQPGIGKLKILLGLGHSFSEILLGLGLVRARIFLAQALGHIWAISGPLFLEILLGHIWAIFRPGRWVTLERFSKNPPSE
jgi:hypothetical protein